MHVVFVLITIAVAVWPECTKPLLPSTIGMDLMVRRSLDL